MQAPTTTPGTQQGSYRCHERVILFRSNGDPEWTPCLFWYHPSTGCVFKHLHAKTRGLNV